MKTKKHLVIGLAIVLATLASTLTAKVYKNEKQNKNSWQLGTFVKVDSVNPILKPDSLATFYCPINKKNVHWMEKDVFNPGAIVRNGKVYLLFRAEDRFDSGKGTSRIGLAESSDGLHFTCLPKPVIFPEKDDQEKFEWEGGCEDPRIVESPDGTYYIYYTSWNGKFTHLNVASSKDLVKWKKLGFVFENAAFDWKGWHWNLKSGGVVTEQKKGRLIAAKINGKYWMYWGVGTVKLATSDDLIHWKPLLENDKKVKDILCKRANLFDRNMVEAGPPAVLTKNGIVLIYNGVSNEAQSKKGFNTTGETYRGGQVLFDANDPSEILDRTLTPFIQPDRPYELDGQVSGVVFSEGLVFFKNRWFLYYGTADSMVGVAVTEPVK
jgi:predicted GH43/DUF377 family glycosyl hydrolase